MVMVSGWCSWISSADDDAIVNADIDGHQVSTLLAFSAYLEQLMMTMMMVWGWCCWISSADDDAIVNADTDADNDADTDGPQVSALLAFSAYMEQFPRQQDFLLIIPGMHRSTTYFFSWFF